MRSEMRDSHQLRIDVDDGYEAEENGRKSSRLRRIVFAVVFVVLLVALFSSRRAVNVEDVDKRGALLESRDSVPLEDAGKKMGGSLAAGVRPNIWEDSNDRRSWTHLGKFPFVVAIYYFRDDTHYRQVHCTGTLIGPHKVLTAAHCLRNPYENKWYEPTDLQVAAGSVDGDLDIMYADPNVQMAQSRKLVPYHGFESSNFNKYDVGIILLDSEIVPTKAWFPDRDYEYYINYAELPQSPSDPLPERAKDARAQFYAVGYGTDHKGSESRRLRFDRAEAVIPENDECKERYSKARSNTATCVKNPRQKTSKRPKGLSCPGDSGGPLVRAVAKGSHTQVWGVAAMGAHNRGEMCSAGPSLYEALPFYMSWIPTIDID